MKKTNLFTKLGLTALLALGIGTQANAAYPAIEDLLANKYSFVAMDFTLNPDNQATYGDVLKSSFSFVLTGTSQSPKLENFIYTGSSFNCLYDQNTGILTINTVTLRPVSTGEWFAFSPENNPFNGNISASSANLLQLQIEEDGEITVPNFQIGPYTNGTVGLRTVVASYQQIITGIQGKDYGDSAPPKDFSGIYALTGTMYDYTSGGEEPTSSAGDFNLVIKYIEDKWEIINDEGEVVRSGTNYYNSITQIAGYEIEDDGTIRNYLSGINDNTITYEQASTLGVLFNQEPSVDLNEITYYTSYVIGGESTQEWEQGVPAVVFTLNSADNYFLAPFTIWKRYPTVEYNSDAQEDQVVWNYELQYYWTSDKDAPAPSPEEPGDEEKSPFAGSYQFNGTFYNYTNGEITSVSDGFFDLVINNAGQVTAIGQNEVPLSLLNEGANLGTANSDAGTYILTTGPNTLVGTDPTLLIGGSSTEAYAAGQTIVLMVGQNSYSLTPFTIWRAEEDGTYTLVYKWDSNLYQGITLTNALAGWNEEEELEITFTANLTNIEPADVDEWLTNLEYTDETGATKTLEAYATYAGNTASVMIEGLEVGTYDFTLTLSAIADDEVMATSNELTVSVTPQSSAINGLNAAGLENGVYYNLQGVRVANPKNGIYILNGKKVVVR